MPLPVGVLNQAGTLDPPPSAFARAYAGMPGVSTILYPGGTTRGVSAVRGEGGFEGNVGGNTFRGGIQAAYVGALNYWGSAPAGLMPNVKRPAPWDTGLSSQ